MEFLAASLLVFAHRACSSVLLISFKYELSFWLWKVTAFVFSTSFLPKPEFESDFAFIHAMPQRGL